MERFTSAIGEAPKPKRWGKRTAAGTAARYLDGGYGVGKTHLLAAAWHEAPAPKSYLTFAELAGIIGFLGMESAIAAFSSHRLLCIDEFELDDIAPDVDDRHLPPSGDRCGCEGRGHIELVARPPRRGTLRGRRLHSRDRGDRGALRGRPRRRARLPSEGARRGRSVRGATSSTRWCRRWSPEARPASDDRFGDLVAHLRVVPPVQVAAALEGLDAVVVRDLAPLDNQGSALLFVHLVDEIYDSGAHVRRIGLRRDRDLLAVLPARRLSQEVRTVREPAGCTARRGPCRHAFTRRRQWPSRASRTKSAHGSPSGSRGHAAASSTSACRRASSSARRSAESRSARRLVRRDSMGDSRISVRNASTTALKVSWDGSPTSSVHDFPVER